MSDAVAAFVSVAAIALAVAWEPLCRLLNSVVTREPAPPAELPAGPVRTRFAASIDALAVVRNRLVETGCMNEPAAAAVEAITHALVLGTDK